MKIKAWMRAHGVSQAGLADRCDAAQATISRICRGDIPSAEMMRRIAIATKGDVLPNDFFDDLPTVQPGYQPVTVRVSFNGTPLEAIAQAA